MLSVYNLQKQEMEKFFSENKLKGILVQWKAKFEINLKDVKKEWEAHADNHCTQLGIGRHAISQFEQDQIKYTAQISSEAQELIANMKNEEDKLYGSLSKRKLSKTQLKKIMKRKHKVFTPEKLSQFKKMGILTRRQTCDYLSEKDVENILTGGVITPEDAKIILKQGRLDEKELKAEFDKVWIKIVERLPPVYREKLNVEAKVERKLTGYSKKLEDDVNKQLKIRKLRDWGRSFSQDFSVKEKHYTVNRNSSWKGKFVNWVYKNILRTDDPHLIEAQKITDEVFNEARQYLENLKEQKTYFNEAYTLDLLSNLDKFINDKASKLQDHFNFTRDYRVEVYLVVCGYAVEQFEQMADAFRQQNDPREYLEKYQREPLFTRFKNQA